MLNDLLCLLRQIVCRHKFDLDDLEQTGIPELERPRENTYRAWSEYYSQYYEHPSITKRVKWPCCKCGKVFYAHCGLDIAHGGNIVKQA